MSLIDQAGIPPEDLPEWEPPEPRREEEPGVYKRVKVHFETEEDVRDFAERFGVHVGPDTREVWWPANAETQTAHGVLRDLLGDG